MLGARPAEAVGPGKKSEDEAVGHRSPCLWGLGLHLGDRNRGGHGGGGRARGGSLSISDRQCREGPRLQSGAGGPCVSRARREEIWRGSLSSTGSE